MECSVQLKLKILLTAILLTTIPLIGSASVPCTFGSNARGGELSFKFNFSEEDCQRVFTRDGSSLALSVQYPEMRLVKERVLDGELIILRMSHIDPERYDQDRVIEGRKPDRHIDDIDVYVVGSLDVYRFRGKDGAIVFVSDWGNTYVATRLFAHDISISYQYSSNHKNVKDMDAAVLSFLDEHLIR